MKELMLSEPYQNLLKRLATHIPASRLISDPLRTLAYGTDASFYRLIPKVIVKVENEPEVRTVLKACRDLKLAVTFRAAGTSLSGQAISESVLVLLGIEGWRDCRISPDGSEITLGAGILGTDANTYLAPHGKRLGPDPASINSARIVGIVSNNIHTVCSAKKMELETDFKRLAEMCADQVIAADITCCGFAGDRGFTVPELNAHGLRDLKSLLPPDVTAGFATSHTCEIGLSHHSGIDFLSGRSLYESSVYPLTSSSGWPAKRSNSP